MASDVQEQRWANDDLVNFARDALRAHQASPRPAPVSLALGHIFRGRIFVASWFGALCAALVVYGLWAQGPVVRLVLHVAIFAGFGLLIPTLCIWHGLRLVRWCRHGLPAEAVVSEVRLVVKDDERRAQGHRVVRHPTVGEFRDEFDIDAPWAALIAEGSTLDVLVAPDRPKTWLTLGVRRLEAAGRAAQPPAR